LLGPQILVDSMVARPGSRGGRQYHPRSDHHSKVACWALLLDLLSNCALLRAHALGGLVGFGLNHKMRDFRTARQKTLDLVICRPLDDEPARRPMTFARLAESIGIVLGEAQREALRSLPELHERPVGAVHLALEAKACMTEFVKARPRLYDELNSSHQTIHGNSDHVIAAGLAMVNVASEFMSPTRDKGYTVTRHDQPSDAASVIDKLREMPRRSRAGEEGFDAFAVVVVDCRNDGTPVRLVEEPPAPVPGDVYHYEWAIHRMAQLYEQKFREIS
jgi:hypothetical protein